MTPNTWTYLIVTFTWMVPGAIYTEELWEELKGRQRKNRNEALTTTRKTRKRQCWGEEERRNF